MNKIEPGAIKKFKQKGPAFLLMENIQVGSHLELNSFDWNENFKQLVILDLQL